MVTSIERSGSVNGITRFGELQLSYDAWGRLVLIDADGNQHVGVEPVRAFPLSDSRFGISICDAEGREIVWIEQLDALAPAVRQSLEAHLLHRELVPVVDRLVGGSR